MTAESPTYSKRWQKYLKEQEDKVMAQITESQTTAIATALQDKNKQITTLKERITELESLRAEVSRGTAYREQELAKGFKKRDKRIVELEDQLKRHGGHTKDCFIGRGYKCEGKCDCGWAEIEKDLDK